MNLPLNLKMMSFCHVLPKPPSCNHALMERFMIFPLNLQVMLFYRGFQINSGYIHVTDFTSLRVILTI